MLRAVIPCWNGVFQLDAVWRIFDRQFIPKTWSIFINSFYLFWFYFFLERKACLVLFFCFLFFIFVLETVFLAVIRQPNGCKRSGYLFVTWCCSLSVRVSSQQFWSFFFVTWAVIHCWLILYYRLHLFDRPTGHRIFQLKCSCINVYKCIYVFK